MPTFNYKVQDETGKLEEGKITADNKYALSAEMKSQGKTIISVSETSKDKKSFDGLNKLLSRIKLQDKILFTRNLSTMIEAGMPLSRALGVLERQTKSVKFKEVLQKISMDITKGNSLSDSLEKFPKIFSKLMTAMVKVGEESGNLSESLNVIGSQLEKSYSLKKKIKGAMMYPVIIMIVMIIIGVLMMIFMVPTLTATFKDFDMELPWSTQLIIFISDTLAAHSIATLLGGIVGGISLILFVKTKTGSLCLDFVSLRIPAISTIVKEYNTAQATRTLSSLLSSGVGVIDAIMITQDVVQNSYYKKTLLKSVDDVQKGIALSELFIQNEKLYPSLASEMIMVGEETGQLSKMLDKTAKFYEDEVDTKTKDLSTIIEPVLMVFIGAAVGFFAISMITPMYSLTSAL